MRLRKKLTVLTVSFISLNGFSQNIVDAVRYSNIQTEGTARYEAMAGSFGALGADLSSNQVNPAGYGRYSTSLAQFTLHYNSTNAKGSFQENNLETRKGNFKLPNIGIVFTNDLSNNNRGFLYQQFGFGYNRMANFTMEKRYQGRLGSSLLDDFAAGGAGLDIKSLPPFTTLLAYNTYAIDPLDPNNPQNGYVANLLPNDTTFHSRTINTKGGMGDYSFNYSINYLNKLYFGANLSIRTINYNEDYTHSERSSNPSSLVDSFDYKYQLQTKGNGFNLKLGAIYLPNQFLRLGLAFHTKTYYNLKDKWTADMVTYLNTGEAYGMPEASLPIGDYKYRLRTPAKYVASVGVVLWQYGSINFDAELVNYRGNQLKSTRDFAYDPDPNDYRPQNDEIKEKLQPVVNLKLGGEAVIAKNFFIRAGIAHYPKPYKKEFTDAYQATTVYSAGVGFRMQRFNIDLTYKLQNNNEDYIAYQGSTAHFKNSASYFIGSFSFRF